ncbi:MAG TPA: hypothetical protein VIT41_08705 [Microlunatus sp.]
MTIEVESDLLLCISPDNRMLHVGPAAEVIPHVALSATSASRTRTRRPPQPLEVYDLRGARISPDRLRRLATAGEHPADTELREGIAKSSDPFSDPQRFVPAGKEVRQSRRLLLHRVNEALDFVQAYLTAHPEAGFRGPGIPRATEVPRSKGGYADLLQVLATELSPLDPAVHSSRGNWFHNLWHAANGTS